MNRLLGLILSTLFIASIVIEASPLLTTIIPQAAGGLPSAGQIGAIYITNVNGLQIQSIAFVVNVSNVNLTKINSNEYNAITDLILAVSNNIQMYFEEQNAVTGQVYISPQLVTLPQNLTLPGTTYTYYVYYDAASKIVFFLVGVGYNGSVSKPEQIPINYLQSVLPDVSQAYESDIFYYDASINNVTTLSSANVNYIVTNPYSTLYYPTTGKAVNQSVGTSAYTILQDLSSLTTLQNLAKNQSAEFIAYATLQATTIGGVTLGSSYSNHVIIFGPLVFSTSPSQTGFINPTQANDYLGSALASVATTKPVIWGRALINFTLVDGLLGAGKPGQFTFQLNYSSPGPVTLSFASMAFIASIDNYPSTFKFNAYKFSNGYLEFFGVITSTNTTTLNGMVIPPSGVLYYNGKILYYLYLLTLTPVPKNGTVNETVHNLHFYLPNIGNVTAVAFINGKPYPTNFTLPVYAYYIPSGATLTGTFNGKTYTVNLVEPTQPTLSYYSGTIQLTATGYEGLWVSGVNSPIYQSALLSTPPSSLAIQGSSQISAVGHFTSTAASVTTTLLTNATLTYANVPAEDYSFNGLIITPAYPIINGTSAMGYMISVFYQGFTNGEYPLYINGTQETFTVNMYNSYLNLAGTIQLPYFALLLQAPNVPAVATGQSPITLEFQAVPQLAYITLVDFGLWTNETSVIVTAYNTQNGTVSANHGYFYAIIIPPRISVTQKPPSTYFICSNSVPLTIYDPDAILDPGYVEGSFTVAIPTGGLNFSNRVVPGAVIFNSSTVYNVSGEFGKYSTVTSTGVSYLPYSQVAPFDPTTVNASVNGNVIPIYSIPNSKPDAEALYYLQYYGSNNPLVNYYFLQSETVNSGYGDYAVPIYGIAGLNVTSIIGGKVMMNNVLPGNMATVGYMDLLPQAAPAGTPYPGAAEPNFTINLYVRYQVDGYVFPSASGSVTVNGTYVGQGPGIYLIVPNASFIGSGFKFVYETTDYAVYHDFQYSGAYKVIATMQVPPVNLTFYFKGNIIPLYATSATLVLYEPYYGSILPTYLALGAINTTNGILVSAQWNSQNYELVNVYATQQLLGEMLSINVTYPNGNVVRIIPSFSNLTTLFVSLIGQEQMYCNGTFYFQISVPGLLSILHTTVTALNGSNLSISYHDYITGQTKVATAKILAQQGIMPIVQEPGLVEFFFTAYPFYPVPTFAPPWFIAEKVYTQPFLSFSDKQYAASAVSSELSLVLTNITIVTNNTVGPKYEAMIYYNATSGQTVVVNVYGKPTTVSGDVMPTIPETAPNSTIFNGTLPFIIVPNSTAVTVKTASNTTVYTNGSLAIILGGKQYVLGPAGYFLLPSVPYRNISVGFNAIIYYTVSDPVESYSGMTYMTALNFTPIRLAPFNYPSGIIPGANKFTYYYNGSLTITPTDQVIKIWVTSVLPYPLEFYIEALVYPASDFNATTGKIINPTEIVYYSYSQVVAKPYLYYLATSQGVKSLLVYVQLNGISSLPAGKYVIILFAVPYAGGPTISEYPVSLYFTNVNITT
ncbi:S-layer protein SlaA [Stygiolobus azoricus]|uniref:Uncharacterized protein n=1 Tax=Stygiolobus azoricus TaxID=41675 RepID=A0A650CQJ4_9CREN|nr:S-layer protein SlaA [Stygiolobus azoricus]QGR20110.1 hypothetical protein D1868_08995 [Stygiolobus azoricus]